MKTSRWIWQPSRAREFKDSAWAGVRHLGGRLPCFWCGAMLHHGDATTDHVKPLTVGGPDREENMVVACHPCNQERGLVTVALLKPARRRDAELRDLIEKWLAAWEAKFPGRPYDGSSTKDP